MRFNYDEVDQSWHPLFKRHEVAINEILTSLNFEDVTPERHNLFRAFSIARSDVKVVIFGQDPYPGDGVADGLAFSAQKFNPIPASLRNIFREYSDDLSLPTPTSPDLSKWLESGVALLNRSLTTSIGVRNAHVKKGWSNFTYDVARELGEDAVVGILWGNSARELAPLFEYRIESVHPSPLSARNGFFGSKPFSKSNELLRLQGKAEISWLL